MFSFFFNLNICITSYIIKERQFSELKEEQDFFFLVRDKFRGSKFHVVLALRLTFVQKTLVQEISIEMRKPHDISKARVLYKKIQGMKNVEKDLLTLLNK